MKHLARARTRWTIEDDRALAHEWGSANIDVMARRFGRTPLAIFTRASSLGLYRRECWATLEEVAKESGFDRERVARILRWKRVRVMRNMGKGTAGKRTVIDRDEALEAVEAWCQTETARMAADARGKSYAWLKRRLVQAGIFVPSYGHRYQAGEIDVAVSKYRKRSDAIGRNQHSRGQQPCE